MNDFDWLLEPEHEILDQQERGRERQRRDQHDVTYDNDDVFAPWLRTNRKSAPELGHDDDVPPAFIPLYPKSVGEVRAIIDQLKARGRRIARW